MTKVVPGSPSSDTASGESTTERVRERDGNIFFPEILPRTTRRAMSTDGRYVAFVSTAVNLAQGQQDGGTGRDVFLYDRLTGLHTLVSRSAASPAIPGDGASYAPVISGDGRYVAFVSTARNLVPGQTDGNDDFYPPASERGEDVFLYDRDTGSVTLVSRTAASAVTTGDYRSRAPVLSADGRYVVFESNASNLVAGQNDSPVSTDVFLYDRDSGVTTLVSHAVGSATTAAGVFSFGSSNNPEEAVAEISAGGGFVVFLSASTNLVAGQTGQGTNLFLFERSTGNVSLVSHANGAPTTAQGAWFGFGISADGGYVVLTSEGTDLVAGQTESGAFFDVFLYDRQTATHTLVSRMPSSTTAAGGGSFATMDPAADHVVFSSDGALVTGQTDSNGVADLFVFDRAGGTVALVSRASSSPSTTGNGRYAGPVISADGSVVLFNSTATDLVAGQSDPNIGWDVFAYGLASGTTTLVSRTAAGPAGSGRSFYPLVSADGRYVAFTSEATDLVPGVEDLNGGRDVFLHDRVQQSTTVVSLHGPGMVSTTPPVPSWASGISADGRFAVFLSQAGDLVPGQIDQNAANDVFLYDRISGTTLLVSRASGTSATTGNAESKAPSISADGSYVVFNSVATNLVPGQSDGNGAEDVFLFARSTGTVTLVSGAGQSSQATASAGSEPASISNDGRWIVFASAAADLVPGQVDSGGPNGPADVFLRDRVSGTTLLVSRQHGTSNVAGNGSSLPSLSADGRFVTFSSSASNLMTGLSGDTSLRKVFVYDRVSSSLQLVSFASGAPATVANAASGASEISADGRFIAFESWATNLVPGQEDTNNQADIFLHDRLSGSTILVTGAENSPTRTSTTLFNVYAKDFTVSANGRYVAFESQAQDLVPGQVDNNNDPFAPGPDVFVFDRLTGVKTLASHVEGSPTTTWGSGARLSAISADGNSVLLNGHDAHLYDVPSGNTTVISRPNPPATGSANGVSGGVALSADGHFAVFHSRASNLAENDFNNAQDVFLYTRGPLPGRDFHTLSPCRVLDTRQPQDGPALVSGQAEILSLHGVCGVPATARAVAVNVTVTQPTGAGYVSFAPGDLGDPFASTINFGPGQTRANNAILPLALNGLGTLRVSPAVAGNGTVHLILDVVGYFE